MALVEILALRFWKCARMGDAEDYARDIQAAGGKVVGMQVDHGHKECILTVEVADPKAFAERFRRTRAAGFTRLG